MMRIEKTARMSVLAVVLLAVPLLLAACGSSRPENTSQEAATSAPPPVATEAPAPSPTPAGFPADTPGPLAAPTAVSEVTTAVSEVTAAPAEPTETPAEPPPATATPVPAPEGRAPEESPTAPVPAPGATIPLAEIGLKLAPVVQGLDQPLFVTHAGDGSGRVYVVEKPGLVRIVEGGALREGPFLDIRDRVLSRGSEQGLLGLAFPPDYATRKYFFVNYTGSDGNTVISRFSADPASGSADPASELVVMRIDQPAPNHNGGMLAFGPDGYLYVGTGDGGAANDRFGNGQNPDTLLGKMLRLDVTGDPSQPYTVPQDNPWAARAWEGRDVRDEIWAVGLRNPWRYSFDRATGDLWIADVGQNQYEEVHLIRASGGRPPLQGYNFGWPVMEGEHCFGAGSCDSSGLEIPVAEYSHGADGCSVTGGYVYRGAEHGALRGLYVYGDYCSGRIWMLRQGEGGWEDRLALESGLNISSFGEDESGELYITDLSGGGVYRIVPG